MNWEATTVAHNIRAAIEAGLDGDQVGPMVLDLVQQLGGRADIMREAVANGRHSLAMTYLLALVLTEGTR